MPCGENVIARQCPQAGRHSARHGSKRAMLTIRDVRFGSQIRPHGILKTKKWRSLPFKCRHVLFIRLVYQINKANCTPSKLVNLKCSTFRQVCLFVNLHSHRSVVKTIGSGVSDLIIDPVQITLLFALSLILFILFTGTNATM